MARVTVVVATYNRPELLKQTIQSIRNQTIEDWKLLVIGDVCSEETASIITEFSDTRIFYVNLKERCGEQAGPNSIGMAVANTPYIAFANHDDIWLPNHLEHALEVLDTGDVDFFCGQAVFTNYALAPSGKMRPAFVAKSPENRTLEMAFATSAVMFEPVSSWVISRDLFLKVGVWHSAITVHRTPLQHWVLRAWRQGAKPYFASKVTCIYCNAEKYKWKQEGEDNSKSMYAMGDTEGAFWNHKIEQLGLDTFMRTIDEEVALNQRKVDYFKKPHADTSAGWVFETLLTDDNRKLYQEFGWDAYGAGCSMTGRKKGHLMTNILKRRTGETLFRRTSWDEDINYVRSELSKNEFWNE